MPTIYIVNAPEEGGCEHDHLAMKRIFTTREAVDAFMLSQTWRPDRCYKPERMVLPYTAVSVCFEEDGTILSEQEIDYSAHAPPTPADEGRVKACGAALAAKMLAAASPGERVRVG